MLYHKFDQTTIYSQKTRAYLPSDFELPFVQTCLLVHEDHFYTPDGYENTLTPLRDILDDEFDRDYDDPMIAQSFLFLRQSTITSFFMTHMVDMPLCFKKSKSLFMKTFEIPSLKFTNMLMRHGKRGHALKNTSYTFSTCFHKAIPYFLTKEYYRWYELHSTLGTVTWNARSGFQSAVLRGETELYANHTLYPDGSYEVDEAFVTKNFLFEQLLEQAPVFSFYIRKVDKSIRKNSRGKSGKYTIIWKYVPVYKRVYVTMRWLLKELQFLKLKTLPERLVKVVETFLLTPHLSFAAKLRRFTHFFVFHNFKQSLLKTLRSTS